MNDSDALEVTLTGLRALANGEVALYFAVHKDDAWKTQHLIGKVGHPFGMVLARINYQAGPAALPSEDPEQPQPEKATAQAIPLTTPAERSGSNQTRGITLPEHVAIKCKDVRFQRWLSEFKGVDFDQTAEWVRNFCGVESRAEILPDSKAEARWNIIESAYLAEKK